MARAVETAAIGTLLVAPWLATVLARHGLSPFLGAAGNSGFWLRGSLARLLSPQATGELGLPIVACLALLGTVVSVARREFLLPAWLLAAFILTPRAALTPATAPLALLAALALAGVVAPGLASAIARPRAAAHADRGSPGRPAAREGLRDLAYGSVIVVLIGYTLVVSNLARTDESWATMRSVPEPEREAMAWVGAHTPAASRFVVASSATWWPADPVNEWFPALTSRASVVAPNGAEWLPRGEFKRLEEAYTSLKGCSAVDGPCLDALSAKFGVDFTHVYVSKSAEEGASGAPAPRRVPARGSSSSTTGREPRSTRGGRADCSVHPEHAWRVRKAALKRRQFRETAAPCARSAEPRAQWICETRDIRRETRLVSIALL